MKELEPLSKKVLFNPNGLDTMIRWYPGHHPEMKGAKLTFGWSGPETRVETQIIPVVYEWEVKE